MRWPGTIVAMSRLTAPGPEPGDDLDRAECLALLTTVPFGRVGVSVDALPVIVPVGFVLAGERVVCGARTPWREVAALDGAIVAFEADTWDAGAGTGWSVLVQGPARRLVDRADLGLHHDRLAPLGWLSGASDLVVVDTTVISGCRLVPATSEAGVGGIPSTVGGRSG